MMMWKTKNRDCLQAVHFILMTSSVRVNNQLKFPGLMFVLHAHVLIFQLALHKLPLHHKSESYVIDLEQAYNKCNVREKIHFSWV
jgi:hypothetical protein